MNEVDVSEQYLLDKYPAVLRAFYMQKVLEYICAKGKATRGDIDVLLMKHLSVTLTERQKRTKIGNLLSLKMNKRFGLLGNCGNDRKSLWVLTDNGVRECKRNNPGFKRTCKRACQRTEA